VEPKSDPDSEIYIEFENGRQLISSTLLMDQEYTESYAVAEAGVERLKALGRDYHTNGQPFLLRMDVVPPHFANRVTKKYASMYDPTDIPPWPNFHESFHNKPAAHLRKHQQWNLQGKDWTWWQQWLAQYYGDCTSIDHCFGMVLDALDELNLTEDTMVIYTTDHADSAGSHKHFEKGGTMYEEVYRVPLIIRWPRAIAQGRVANELVTHLDLMPTLVEAAGASVPDGIDGRSYLPILRGVEQEKWRDSVYLEYHGDVWGCYTQRAVRTDRFKYVYNSYDMDELYDLEEDPYEMANLVDMPSYSEILTEMRARMRGWIESTDDILTHWFVMRNFPEPIYPE
jgi:arylsulfatase A-like enzyme